MKYILIYWAICLLSNIAHRELKDIDCIIYGFICLFLALSDIRKDIKGVGKQ